MRKLWWLSSFFLIICSLVICVQSDAAVKKKRKKKSKTSKQVQTKDSIGIVRAPGVQNQHSYDSLKTEKMKQKKSFSVLVVSFISTGGGIDQEANNELDKFVQNFVKNNECKINSEMKTWGREGEKDYCFSTSDTACMKSFTKLIRTLFQENKRVVIQENGICRDQR